MTTAHQHSALTAVLADMKSDGIENSKRRHTRHKADNLILYVAQIRESGEIPFLVSFFPVRCRDLSCGGVSFLLPAKPSFKRLVVQVGDRQKGFYMESEVMHVSRAREIPEEKEAWDSGGKEYTLELGSTPYQIGCQFTKRVDPPTR